MNPVKRIELVVDAPHSETLLQLLQYHGIRAYTLIPGVQGSGERGLRGADELTGVSDNHYVLTTCPAELLDDLLEAIRPFLVRAGGMCMVSDAWWLSHGEDPARP